MFIKYKFFILKSAKQQILTYEKLKPGNVSLKKKKKVIFSVIQLFSFSSINMNKDEGLKLVIYFQVAIVKKYPSQLHRTQGDVGLEKRLKTEWYSIYNDRGDFIEVISVHFYFIDQNNCSSFLQLKRFVSYS